jgi:SAM-dependent methyltransferase
VIESNKEWELSAKNDALYAIASVKGKRGGKWSLEEFFAKGEVYLSYINEHITNIPRDSNVLDIGCGGGRISRALAKRFARVTGVDVSPTMIDLAKEICADVHNADFKLGDGVNFPIPENSIDLVVSFQVFQHVDSPALHLMFKSCYKALRADGVAIIHVPAPSFRGKIHAFTRLVPIRRILTLVARRLNPEAKLSGRFWINTQYHTYSNSIVFEMLRESGFNQSKVYQWRPSDPLTSYYIAEKNQKRV